MKPDQLSSSPLDAMRIPEFRSLVIGRFIFIMGLEDDEYPGGMVDLQSDQCTTRHWHRRTLRIYSCRFPCALCRSYH